MFNADVEPPGHQPSELLKRKKAKTMMRWIVVKRTFTVGQVDEKMGEKVVRVERLGGTLPIKLLFQGIAASPQGGLHHTSAAPSLFFSNFTPTMCQYTETRTSGPSRIWMTNCKPHITFCDTSRVLRKWNYFTERMTKTWWKTT